MVGRRSLLLLAAGLFAALALLALCINLPPIAGLDAGIENWLDAHRVRHREAAASGIFGYIGRPEHVAIFAVVFGIPLSLRARSFTPLLCVTGVVAVGVAVEGLLKAVIGRTATAGPLLDYQHSYPSGHVMGTAALLGMIAVFLGAGRSRAVRGALAALVIAAVLTVGYLALYSGAHTAIDVLGGMLLGGALVALGTSAAGPRVGVC